MKRFPSPLGDYISLMVYVDMVNESKFVSVPARGRYISNHLSDECYKMATTEFPSPLGDYISLIVHPRSDPELNFILFPSPLGDYISLMRWEIITCENMYEFPSPLGDYISLIHGFSSNT